MQAEDHSHLRVPPHSIEAESSLLGALLLDPEAINRLHGLTGDDFYRREHRLIFAAAVAMASGGQSLDVVSVHEHLVARDEAREVGGLPYLQSLAQYVPSASNIRRYAEIVRERSLMRKIIATADDVATAGFNAKGRTAVEVLDEAQMALAKLAVIKAKREPQHITQSLVAYLDLLQNMSEGKNPAIPTGIVGLDRILNGGMRRGEMMVLGARPKHGKTAVSLAMARSMSERFSVLFISQEMPVSQLMHRHTAAMGSVDLGRILRAEPNDTGMWERVHEAAERLGRLNLIHDDQPAQSLMDVRRKAIKVKREHGLDVLFVDFLQLMQGAGGDESRNRELDIIANGIKGLAMDLDCAVVLLSQMSRKADEHYGRPAMTHLRDSGAIEAAADQVVLLFTDHAHPLSPRSDEFAGYSELEMVAHRNGPQGIVSMHMNGALQQVSDWGGPAPKRQAQKRGI